MAGMKKPPPPVYAGILVCSIGVLMQEVLLTRIFSFTIWYHLAYLTISTALLGFGAAGSILAAFPGLRERHPHRLAAVCAAGSGIALLLAMAWVAPRPLNPDQLLSEPLAFSVDLLGYYVAVAIPFLLAGIAIATPLATYPAQVDRLYAADLLGAGIGCVGAVAALTWLDGPGAICVCAALLVGAGALYASRGPLAIGLASLSLVLAVAPTFAHRLLDFRPAESKALGQALVQPGFESLATRWSPINRVDLYRTANARGSFWGSRGLSRSYRGPRPRVVSIQYDGHNGTDIYEARRPASLRMLDEHLLRTPYVLHEAPRVLVIGVGGGIDVMNALRRGASKVTGVELQPITIELLQGSLAAWTGRQFLRPEVELVTAEGRHYVRSHDDLYDIIQITAVDTFSAQSTGAYVLAESYLYTVEAFGDYLEHLSEDGVVSVVLGDPMYRDRSLPSPLVTRLALVAREALERRGVAEPAAHILLAAQRVKRTFPPKRDSQMIGAIVGDLLVKRTPFSDRDVELVRSFLEPNGFELRLAPGAVGDPTIARILGAPGDDLERILDEQAFALAPVTDDRPFFYHILRWGSLLSGERTVWYFPGSTIGQIMLLIMLGQALLLGGALILLPLLRGPRVKLSRRETSSFLLYFLGLGLGFMLIEISFVQKYVLVLGYPTYSLSVTIFSLLVFAALGAALSRRGWGAPRALLGTLAVATVALVGIEILVLSVVREQLLAAPLAVRLLVTVLLQLPLGIALGMYFPTGVELLRQRDPRLVPWAWAVNGVASVASSVLAVILGMAIGFAGVALLAAAVYVVGTLALLSILPGQSETAVGHF